MDKLNKARRSWNMSRIRSRNTGPEIKLRKYLYNKGLRYRIHYVLRGKPDIVFPKQKIAIFVNGCFWHYHGCKNSTVPKSNTVFWKNKLTQNKERDRKNLQILKFEGWQTLTVWECEIEENMSKVETTIKSFLSE